MKNFMDKDFLLTGETAKVLYHDYALKMPIVDYHCHINPQEICENRHFDNITQMWLEGDHYKWRIMRSNGVAERFITGDATDREKFQKFAEALERCPGNPMYHWCHLELRNYFDYKGELTGETAEEVWQHTCAKLAQGGLSVRDLIRKSNVKFIGTTDDPTDTLQWHQQLQKIDLGGTAVAPSFRPDKVVNIDKPIWLENIQKLSDISGIKLCSIEDVKAALSLRMDFFVSLGCRAADHGLDYVCCTIGEKDEADKIFKKALLGEAITQNEAEIYKTELCIFCAGEYCKRGMVMQLHFNCLRNPNTKAYKALGADSGYDVMNSVNCTQQLAVLLDVLAGRDILPKTVIYSLNPGDNAAIDTIIGAFQSEGIQGKIQHGSAWWFNDTKTGMQEHMTSLANLSILGNFIGMLTDSRSFLSYARHEYFRRILCNLIGEWIDNGEFAPNIPRAGALVQDICCNNAIKYFSIDKKNGGQ